MSLYLLPLLTAAAATEPAHVAESGGIGALGLDGRSLIFQVINFGVLLVLLRIFAYKPILSVLTQRQQTIEEGLKNAVLMEESKKKLKEEQEQVLAQAHQEAKTIVAHGEKRAQEIVAQSQIKAEQQVQRTLEEVQAKMTQASEELKRQLKRETFGLVAAATEQVIQAKLDTEKDKALIERSLKQAEQVKTAH
jgi:F-type H+-transporting ATPase subunit b